MEWNALIDNVRFNFDFIRSNGIYITRTLSSKNNNRIYTWRRTHRNIKTITCKFIRISDRHDERYRGFPINPRRADVRNAAVVQTFAALAPRGRQTERRVVRSYGKRFPETIPLLRSVFAPRLLGLKNVITLRTFFVWTGRRARLHVRRLSRVRSLHPWLFYCRPVQRAPYRRNNNVGPDGYRPRR